MNKSDMIEEMARSADISRAAAERALDAAVECVRSALKRGDEVNLVGFGTFYAHDRAERPGRNPRTGEQINLPAAKVPKFRPGKAFKDALN